MAKVEASSSQNTINPTEAEQEGSSFARGCLSSPRFQGEARWCFETTALGLFRRWSDRCGTPTGRQFLAGPKLVALQILVFLSSAMAILRQA